MGDQKVTINQVQFSNILKYGAADKKAKLVSKIRSEGRAKEYFLGYHLFKKDYKKSFNPAFLKALGYLPSTDGKITMTDNTKILGYLTSIGDSNSTLKEVEEGYLSDSQKRAYVYEYLKGVSGYNSDTKVLSIEDKNYDFVTIHVVDLAAFSIEFTRFYNEAILENLLSRGYDSVKNTIMIGGNTFSVGAFNPYVNSSDQYETVCTHIPKDTVTNPDGSGSVVIEPQLPDVTIYTPVEYYYISYVNALLGGPATYISYTNSAGVSKTTIGGQGTLPIYSIQKVEPFTSIITLKEDNEIVDLKNNKLRRLLKKLNLAPDDFETALGDKELDNAYMLLALDLTDDEDAKVNQVKLRILFDLFDSYIYTKGDVIDNPFSSSIAPKFSVYMDKLNMGWSLRATTGLGNNFSVYSPDKVLCVTDRNDETTCTTGGYDEYIESTVTRNTPGEYVKVIYEDSYETGTDPSGVSETIYYKVMVLKRYITDTEYEYIQLTDPRVVYDISGRHVTATLGELDKMRFVLPTAFINKLSYKDWVIVYERSLTMLAFATKTITLEWYQTSYFSFVLQIGSIVLMIIPGGQPLVIAIRMVAMIVITKLAQMLAEWIGGPLGVAIAVVAAVIAMRAGGFFNASTSTGLWLQAANTAVGVINQSMQHELASIQDKHNAYISSMQQKLDELYEKTEDMESLGLVPQFGSAGVSGASDPMFQTIEQYVGSIVNTEWLVDGAWMYDIERQIEMRNQVYVG